MTDQKEFRPAHAEVSLDAIRANVGELIRAMAPTQVAAVVKADAYGHGAVPVARAAIEAGVPWLAVALVEEGLELRDAGIEAPVLVLSEPPADGLGAAILRGLTPTVYTDAGVAAAMAAAKRADRGRVPVHVKVDTGMHRVGARPDHALKLARAVAASEHLELEGLWTHFAVADEPEREFTAHQLELFLDVAARLAATGVRPRMLHAANSAGAIAHPDSRLDLVRCGIAVYGYPPSAEAAGTIELTPAMSVIARVSHVRRLASGEGVSYGLRWSAHRDTVVATVPLGYADGVPRTLSGTGAEVLIGGQRCPLVGTITMDQLMVDCGPNSEVAVGDEVVLLGAQGTERIDATAWADRIGTITYEIVCRIGPRLPRVYS